MTADLQQVITATPGAKSTSWPPTSPHRKDAPNPQQGMADPSVSVNTAATTSNTACTSPLTVTSFEGAAAATAFNGVPQVVSQVVAAVQPEPTVESMLAAPMAKVSFNRTPQAVAHPSPPMEEKKMRLRTPPTEHDNRKLFVGGLPTDVSDHDFLEFFKQFGEVIDSVVIIDRLTKRSRGFGFVTFADEKYANSLLTAIPGKTGYVSINGKQCEVKASTPKADDGSYKHDHHGAPGMWRSNPPRHDNRGYSTRHPNNAPRPGPTKQTMHHQPGGGKHFSIDNEFNGDVDGRNFDESYAQQPQMNASYQPMSVYGRNLPTSHPPMYHQNYHNVYSTTASNGYAYASSSAPSVPSSWDASYPAAPSQGYGQYASNAMLGNGYYDPYGQQYPNQYGNNSMSSHMMMGQTGYANYSSYYAERGSPVPSQGVNASSDEGFDPYAYSGAGYYDNDATADQHD